MANLRSRLRISSFALLCLLVLSCSGTPPSNTCNSNGVSGIVRADPCAGSGGTGSGGTWATAGAAMGGTTVNGDGGASSLDASTDASSMATILQSGGTVEVAGVVFQAAEGSLTSDIQITVRAVSLPADLPTGFEAVGPAIEVTLDKPEALRLPLTITLKYERASVSGDEMNLLVLHYDSDRGYETTTKLAQDLAGNTITIESLAFSTLVKAKVAQSGPPVPVATSFDPTCNGWDIANFSTPLSPTGVCLGMASYAVWFWKQYATCLWGHFPSNVAVAGAFNIAQLVAAQADTEEGQLWDYFSSRGISSDNGDTIKALKAAIKLGQQNSSAPAPIVLMSGLSNGGLPCAHAVVAYAYDASRFHLYDVNNPYQRGVSNSGVSYLPYLDADDGGKAALGPYQLNANDCVYNKFSCLARPSYLSYWPLRQFAQLTTQANRGFTLSPSIAVTAPLPNAGVSLGPTVVAGDFSLNPAAQLYLYTNGTTPTAQLSYGPFSTQITPDAGQNTLLFLGGQPPQDGVPQTTTDATALVFTFYACPAGQTWCSGSCVNSTCTGGKFNAGACQCECDSGKSWNLGSGRCVWNNCPDVRGEIRTTNWPGYTDATSSWSISAGASQLTWTLEPFTFISITSSVVYEKLADQCVLSLETRNEVGSGAMSLDGGYGHVISVAADENVVLAPKQSDCTGTGGEASYADCEYCCVLQSMSGANSIREVQARSDNGVPRVVGDAVIYGFTDEDHAVGTSDAKLVLEVR